MSSRGCPSGDRPTGRGPRASGLRSTTMSPEVLEHAPDRRPVAQGMVVMTTLGLGWAFLGVSGAALPPLARAALAAGAVAAAVTVMVTAMRSLRGLPARAGRARRVSPNAGRSYGLINVAQTVVVVLAVLALLRAGQAGLIPAVTCAVVGAHFLPLARIFDLPLYRWSGLLLILTAVVGALVSLQGMDAGPARAVVGSLAALVLWGTSIAVARRG